MSCIFHLNYVFVYLLDGSQYIAQTSLELPIPLPQLPQCTHLKKCVFYHIWPILLFFLKCEFN